MHLSLSTSHSLSIPVSVKVSGQLANWKLIKADNEPVRVIVIPEDNVNTQKLNIEKIKAKSIF